MNVRWDMLAVIDIDAYPVEIVYRRHGNNFDEGT